MKIRKNVVTIAIYGPVSSGKSVIAGQIKEMLRKQYGSSLLVSEDRSGEEPLEKEHKQWELDMVKDSVVVITEADNS